MTPLSKSILQLLLGRGYFPKELPTAFTTTDFGKHSEDILAEWKAAGLFSIKESKKLSKVNGIHIRGRYKYERINPADPEVISKPKKLYERRNLHITHPIPQALLTKEIANNWKKIHRILSKRIYSEDNIVISDRYERAIEDVNFPLHRAKKSYIEATADWLVQTDISRFYPNIYTHSIPWAAYGKERVKSDLNIYIGSLADRLDMLVRMCNRNQTIGIPIGPETSRILAEIISSRIDSEYSAKLTDPESKKPPDPHTIDRLQDDWVVGAKTLEEAEKILSVISGCYREYGLEINGSKTSITHILASNIEEWKSEISAFLSHRRGGLRRSRLEEFLNLSLRLQLEFPSKPVMNYALSVVEGQRYSKRDVQTLESHLLKAAAISPSSMDRICRIILNIQYDIGGLSKTRFVRRFTTLAERHFKNGNLFEVIWLLYTIRGLNKPFASSRIMEYAEKVPSSAIRLLLLDMYHKGLCISKPPLGTWQSDISENRVLSDWTWLYAYEALRKGWLNDQKGILKKPFFKALDDRDIVFYNPKKNVKRSKKIKHIRISIRKQQYIKVISFMNSLRHVHVDEDDFDWYDY